MRVGLLPGLAAKAEPETTAVTLRQTRAVATSFFIESFRKWAANRIHPDPGGVEGLPATQRITYVPCHNVSSQLAYQNKKLTVNSSSQSRVSAVACGHESSFCKRVRPPLVDRADSEEVLARYRKAMFRVRSSNEPLVILDALNQLQTSCIRSSAPPSKKLVRKALLGRRSLRP